MQTAELTLPNLVRLFSDPTNSITWPSATNACGTGISCTKHYPRSAPGQRLRRRSTLPGSSASVSTQTLSSSPSPMIRAAASLPNAPLGARNGSKIRRPSGPTFLSSFAMISSGLRTRSCSPGPPRRYAARLRGYSRPTPPGRGDFAAGGPHAGPAGLDQSQGQPKTPQRTFRRSMIPGTSGLG
jgi:hypothetical protein